MNREELQKAHRINHLADFPSMLSARRRHNLTIQIDRDDRDITEYEILDGQGRVCGAAWCHHEQRLFRGEFAVNASDWTRFMAAVDRLVAEQARQAAMSRTAIVRIAQ